MPKFLENDLKAEAAKKGYSGKRADAYVYGTMNNIGAMHGSKETAKGAAMEAKHEADKGKSSGSGKSAQQEAFMAMIHSRRNNREGR